MNTTHAVWMLLVSSGSALAGSDPLIVQPPGDPGGTIRSATTQRIADNFTSPANATVASLGWWGAAGSAESGDWIVEIYASDGFGGVGVSLYEELILNESVDQSPHGLRHYWEVDLSGSVSLEAGHEYWLSVYRFGGSLAFLWTTNPDSADGRYGRSIYPDSQDDYLITDGTFDMAWQIIPAPGGSALLLGAGAQSVLRRRRR